MNVRKLFFSPLLLIFASAYFSGGCGGTRGETPEVAPTVSFSIEFGANHNAAILSLAVCLTNLKFTPTVGDSVSSSVSIDSVNLTASGTPLTTVSIPAGSYQSIQADLSSTCASGKSVQLTNLKGTFTATSSITLGFQGAFTANSSLRTLTLDVQPLADALTAVDSVVTSDIQIKTAAESTAGKVVTSTSGSIVFQQFKSGNNLSSSNSVTTSNFPQVTAGNLMVCSIYYFDNTVSVSNVSDSIGNTYVKAVGPTTGAGSLGTARVEIWYAANITAGVSSSVTSAFSGSFGSFKEISCFEYSGAVLSNPLDQVGPMTGSGTALVSASVTTTAANELIFAGCFSELVPTNGAGFTLRSYFNNSLAYEDKIIHSVGSYSATCTGSTAQDWIVSMVTFKAQ